MKNPETIKREMHSADPIEERRTAISVRIAAIALGLFMLALLNSRGAFAMAMAVGGLATMVSPGVTETFRQFRRAAISLPVLATAAVLVVWSPSTIMSSYAWESIQVQVRMAMFLVFGVWIYAYFLDRPRALDLLLKTLFVGTVFGVAVANVSIWNFPELMLLIKGRPAVNSVQAILMVKAFGSAVVVLVPLVVWAGWRLGGGWKGGAVVLVLASMTLIVLADSRAGMAGLLGAIGGGLIACLARKQSRWQGGGLAFVLVVAMVVIFAILAGRDSRVSLPDELLRFPSWLVDPHRQLIWQYTIELMALSPWTGWGINTIDMVPPPIGMSVIEFGMPTMPSHPHNWILEIFAETGVLGGLPMLAAITLLFVETVRRYRVDGDPRFSAMLAASGAFWVSGLFNFSFWSAWWQVSYILIVALLCAGVRKQGG